VEFLPGGFGLASGVVQQMEEIARIRAFFFCGNFSSRFRALNFASRSRAQKREKSAGTRLCF
jgi:hypothetical protein